jgi:hypothetical protein
MKEEIDKRAALTLISLMYITDNMNELREHPIYGGLFKGQLKITAKSLTMHYDRMLATLNKQNEAYADSLVESYKSYCDLVENAFEIKTNDNEEAIENTKETGV